MERCLWDMVGKARVVTFIGAGGKTTCLSRLTEEISQAEKPVIATTTTKVYPLAFSSLWQNADGFSPPKTGMPCFWYANLEAESGKWMGIPVDILDQAIQKEFGKSFWVIEGDGARERQLKCWASYEPQIPHLTESAVLVIDGRLWGKKLQAREIHRPELYPHLIGEIWRPELAWQYILTSPMFYSEYQKISWSVLFNRWGDPGRRSSQDLGNDELRGLIKVGEEFLGREHLSDSHRPQHLRIASGNAKEGNLQWYDLW
ncbi:selenium cofactor biosynthesis protein YqeC [Desulfitobacterium metallireducens]|uniref:Hydroxylase accessory protein YqeC n=1 Tax=Desulfitobacterium metallireducens DSM 15288 TaxID=871968 RepID=W0EBJ8_9FIRM|nr:selenium cofactor biosynthesis protein YqeC [Desulfitobacterium metallireducens]AHF08137.1 hydroxylase accessory protein YqeC [Desulfitobacterium metallireducens DSM 15288]